MDYRDWDRIRTDELRSFFINKKVVLKNDFGRRDNYYKDDFRRMFVNYDLKITEGKTVTIRGVTDSGTFNYFKVKENSNYYEFGMIDKIIANIETTNEDIQKGDLVKIKQQEEGEIIDTKYDLPIVAEKYNIPELEEKNFIVKDIKNNMILPYYLDDVYVETPINTGMVEIVEKNYLEKIQNKKRKTAQEKKIIDDLTIIDEMISKVNLKDFMKIYAGSVGKKPDDVKGIDLLLHQWAFNKKHLYKLLDNNFNIVREVEYSKSAGDMESERQELYKKFPVAYYVLDGISNEEMLDNRLNHYYEDYGWTNVLNKSYSSGEKISKLLNEACNNKELNMAFSDIIAQNKLKGFIEISIDPVEILLMSYNQSGWSSCHTITKGKPHSYGCYSAGIFSYMCDSTSMIAFRHNGKLFDMKTNKSKVQRLSKSWRQMIYVKEDLSSFIMSRQYPADIPEITKTVRETLEEKINEKQGEFVWVHSDNKDKIQNVITDRQYRDIYNLHYNDMLHNYQGDLCYKKDTKPGENSISIGSHPICPYCGKQVLNEQGKPYCKDCYDKM